MKILFSLQLLIRRLAQEVIDEPLAQHGEIGNGRDESRFDAVKATPTQGGNSQSYLLRRLARDGAAEAKVRMVRKPVDSAPVNLPEQKNKGDARDQAASVVGVSGKMVGDAN